MNILATLVLMVIFAGFSEAGVIEKTYNEALDETIVRYEVAEGDNPWNIHREVVPEKTTMEAVERDIMKLNDISDETTLGIGTVLVIKIEGKYLDASTSQNEKSAVAVENPKMEKMADAEGISISIKEGVPSVAAINHVVDHGSVSNVAKSSQLLTDEASEEKSTANDLINSLQTAKAKIAELEGIIVSKNQEILSLKKELDEIKKGAVGRKEKSHSRVESGQIELKNNYEEAAFRAYANERALFISLSVFIILALLIAWAYFYFHNREGKYDSDRERRIIAARLSNVLKV